MINNLRYLLRSDLYRYSGQRSLKSFLQTYNKSCGFKFTVWLRLCFVLRQQLLTKYLLFPICSLFYNHYRYKFGYDIPYSIPIGPGFLIYHFGGIVFSPQYCGKNVTISHCTTVGMTIKNGKKYFPIIGDNVYMAPGSKIIGDVIVANNTAIGTNAVLNMSTNENDVIVGIPGRVASNKGASLYINNPI